MSPPQTPREGDAERQTCQPTFFSPWEARPRPGGSLHSWGFHCRVPPSASAWDRLQPSGHSPGAESSLGWLDAGTGLGASVTGQAPPSKCWRTANPGPRAHEPRSQTQTCSR